MRDPPAAMRSAPWAICFAAVFVCIPPVPAVMVELSKPVNAVADVEPNTAHYAALQGTRNTSPAALSFVESSAFGTKPVAILKLNQVLDLLAQRASRQREIDFGNNLGTFAEPPVSARDITLVSTDQHWTGTVTTTWNLDLNWNSQTVPTSADNAVFDTTFSNQPSVTVATSVGGLWMTGSVAQNVIISGATLTLNGNTINGTSGLGILVDNSNAFKLTITASLALAAAQTWRNNSGNLLTVGAGGVNTNGQALTIDGTGDTTISGIISGSGTLTKAGAGTLTLSDANTYTGSTTISAGTLIAAATSGSALGSTSGITVNSGATLRLGTSNQINDSATLTLAGGTFAKGNFSEGNASSIGLGTLILTASGSHIDFGTGTVGVLNFASFNPGTNILLIDNWAGTANTVGNASTDRLIFHSDQLLNLADFSFTGYLSGATEFALGGGYFEIVPVAALPEPATYLAGLFAIGVIVHDTWRRFRSAKSNRITKRRPA
jgi:autotransporter-associated beta strand protein